MAEYAERWKQRVQVNVRHGTFQNVASALRRHIVPAFGAVPLRAISHVHVRDFIFEKLAAGLKRSTARGLISILHGCLEKACGDGLLRENPAAFPHRKGLTCLRTSRAERAVHVKALDAGQLRRFLAAAEVACAPSALILRLLVLTGLRLGEALALRLDDVDLATRHMVVRRGWSHGRVEPTKTGVERTVDLAKGLAEAWVFGAPTPHTHNYVERDCKRALAHAGLPLHFTPHCLRHTYATQLLLAGESVYYVQRQLGHSSISMTADTYGSWLSPGDTAVVDRFEERVLQNGVPTARCADQHRLDQVSLAAAPGE